MLVNAKIAVTPKLAPGEVLLRLINGCLRAKCVIQAHIQQLYYRCIPIKNGGVLVVRFCKAGRHEMEGRK